MILSLALFKNCFFLLPTQPLNEISTINSWEWEISQTKLGNAQVKGIVNSMMEVADDVVNLSNYGDETEVYVVAEALTNRFAQSMILIFLRIIIVLFGEKVFSKL